MKKGLFIIVAYLLAFNTAFAQGTAINHSGAHADSSAMLDLSSSFQGLLLPRMTTQERDSILSPASSLMIYNTTTQCIQLYENNVWQSVFCACTPLALAGSISGANFLCDTAGLTTYSINPVTGASSYLWTVPFDATIVSGQGTHSIVVNFGSASGTVCVTAINSCYTSAAPCKAVAVRTKPTAVLASASPIPICPGDTLQLSGSGNCVTSWYWTGPNGFVSFDQNPTIPNITSGATGHYNLRASNSHGYTLFNNLEVLVTSPPAAPAAWPHNATSNQITWNWSTCAEATEYYYNTVYDFNTATSNGSSTSYTQSGLSSGTTYTLYVWSSNCSGHSPFTILIQATQ